MTKLAASVDTILNKINAIEQSRTESERELTIHRLELDRLAATVYRAPKVLAATKINERKN